MTGIPFHWQEAASRRDRAFCWIEFDVIADEEIQVAVAVVVEKRAAGSPADLFVVDTSLARHVGEGSVAVVVKENVVSPEAAEQIVPAIVVVVADANAGLPAGAAEAGFFRDVGECSVAIVFVEVRSGRFAGGPLRIEARSVGQIDVEPAIVVVVEESDAAALWLR